MLSCCLPARAAGRPARGHHHRASRAPARPPPARSSRTSATPSWTTCPATLLRDLAELVANDPERYDRVAIVLDVRQGDAPLALGAALGALHGRGHRAPGLLPRGERRGPHPALLGDAPSPSRSTPRTTASRRPSPASARCSRTSATMAQVIIDTTDLSFKQLRERIMAALGAQPGPDAALAPGHQLRLQVRRAAGGGPRLRRALHGEPVLPTGAARASPGLTEPVRDVRAGPAHHPAVPAAPRRALRHRSSRPTWPRARRASPSPSAAPAGSIARWPSARRSPRSWRDLDLGPVSVWHRELEKRR